MGEPSDFAWNFLFEIFLILLISVVHFLNETLKNVQSKRMDR